MAPGVMTLACLRYTDNLEVRVGHPGPLVLHLPWDLPSSGLKVLRTCAASWKSILFFGKYKLFISNFCLSTDLNCGCGRWSCPPLCWLSSTCCHTPGTCPPPASGTPTAHWSVQWPCTHQGLLWKRSTYLSLLLRTSTALFGSDLHLSQILPLRWFWDPEKSLTESIPCTFLVQCVVVVVACSDLAAGGGRDVDGGAALLLDPLTLHLHLLGKD